MLRYSIEVVQFKRQSLSVLQAGKRDTATSRVLKTGNMMVNCKQMGRSGATGVLV